MPNWKYARLTFLLTCLAAVFYNSWPLGYILDNPVAHNQLASDLETAGHPYFWVFVAGDMLTAACCIAAALAAFKLGPVVRSRAMSAMCVGLLLFGTFTAVSALVTSQCSPSRLSAACGTGHVSGLGIDVLTSSVAALGLLAALAAITFKGNRIRPHAILTRLTEAMLIAWSFSGVVFVKVALSGGDARVEQYVLLVLSGLALIMIGYGASAVPAPHGPRKAVAVEPGVKDLPVL